MGNLQHKVSTTKYNKHAQNSGQRFSYRFTYDCMADNLLTKLRKIDPTEFEYFIADLWEEMGYQTEVSQRSRDEGIDIKATNHLNDKHLIQVKRHSESSVIGGPKVREYAGLYLQENDVDKVYVVTTNGFTSQARKIADNADVELVNAERLVKLINQVDREKLISEYCINSHSSVDSTTQQANSTPNYRRVKQKDILPNADLEKAFLKGAEISGVNLSGANLSAANLDQADLSYANLSNAELVAVNLPLSIDYEQLLETSYPHADRPKTEFAGTNLNKANLTETNLTLSDLSNSELCNADFTSANVIRVDLSNANLSNAVFYNTDLRGANLCDTDLRGANFCDADLSNANLRDADLTNADFSGANLSNADLANADFSYSNLTNTDLSDTDFSQADLSEANLLTQNRGPNTNDTDESTNRNCSTRSERHERTGETKISEPPQFDHQLGTFPWLNYQRDKWKVPCPYCEKQIHNHPESFVNHWYSNSKCKGAKREKPSKLTSISDGEWKKLYNKLE